MVPPVIASFDRSVLGIHEGRNNHSKHDYVENYHDNKRCHNRYVKKPFVDKNPEINLIDHFLGLIVVFELNSHINSGIVGYDY